MGFSSGICKPSWMRTSSSTMYSPYLTWMWTESLAFMSGPVIMPLHWREWLWKLAKSLILVSGRWPISCTNCYSALHCTCSFCILFSNRWLSMHVQTVILVWSRDYEFTSSILADAYSQLAQSAPQGNAGPCYTWGFYTFLGCIVVFASTWLIIPSFRCLGKMTIGALGHFTTTS